MSDPEFFVRNIVNQLADLWHVPVNSRQATNDRAYRLVDAFIKKHTASELRKLASAFSTAAAHVPLTRPGDQLSLGRIIAYQECRDIAEHCADELDPDPLGTPPP